MDNCKISQGINRQQVEVLTNFMSEHTDLARGLLKAVNGKQLSNNLWKSLASSLNERGPPVRAVPEWKKVWADYKYKVKNKLRVNKNSFKKTGGGRFDQKSLDAFELSVVESAGIEAAVDGIKLCKSFGAKHNKEPQVSEKEAVQYRNANEADENNDYIISFMEEEVTHESEHEKENEGNLSSRSRSATSKKSKVEESKLNLFKKYVSAIEEQNTIQKEILEFKKKKYTLKKKSFDIKEKQYRLYKKRAEAEEERKTESFKLKKILIETKIEENRLR